MKSNRYYFCCSIINYNESKYMGNKNYFGFTWNTKAILIPNLHLSLISTCHFLERDTEIGTYRSFANVVCRFSRLAATNMRANKYI